MRESVQCCTVQRKAFALSSSVCILWSLSANATVLGSITESSDTVKSEGAADETVLNKVHEKIIRLAGPLLYIPWDAFSRVEREQ
jgi:hypothetical protein